MALPIDFTLPNVLAQAPGKRAAILVIDGLSVCCFNRTKMFWEVAYPRQSEHELRITIWELDGDDNRVGQEPKYDKEVHPDIVSFNISLTKGSTAHYNQYPRGGPVKLDFERLDPDNDPHDLAWLIDLAGPELQHEFRRLLPRDPSRPVSLARIRHSMFCTLKPEAEPVVISPRRHNNPRHPDRFVLGRNNTEIVGVLLATEAAGEIRFASDPAGLLDINPLPYDQNKRYRIEIINMDTNPTQRVPPFVRGDLHLFYGHVIEVGGEQKELWAFPVEDGRFAPDGDCHTNGFSGQTLQDLIEP